MESSGRRQDGPGHGEDWPSEPGGPPLSPPLPLQPSKWTLPSWPVCPWSLSPRLQPLPFLSTLNLCSRFWTYCGPDYGFTPPVRCLANSSNRGHKEVPRQSLELQVCPLWRFSQLRGPPKRQVLPRLLVVRGRKGGRGAGSGSGCERLDIWKEHGFLKP